MLFLKLPCQVKSSFRYGGKEQVIGTVEGRGASVTVADKRSSMGPRYNTRA